MKDNEKEMEERVEEVEEVETPEVEEGNNIPFPAEALAEFLQMFLERPTLDEAIREQQEEYHEIQEAFDELDKLYKEVLQNRVEYFHAIMVNRVRLMISKALSIAASEIQRTLIDRAMDASKEAKKALDDGKETIDTVGINLEKARKYNMIEYGLEFKALITALNNRDVYIMKDYAAKLKAYNCGLKGAICSIPSDNAENRVEVEEHIELMMRRLGIQNKSA